MVKVSQEPCVDVRAGRPHTLISTVVERYLPMLMSSRQRNETQRKIRRGYHIVNRTKDQFSSEGIATRE